jgi:FG-GAP-like repeat/FG-GAP repeat
MITIMAAPARVVVGLIGLCFLCGCGACSSGPQGPSTRTLSVTSARGVRALPPRERRFAVGRSPGSVEIADFNADGKLDIVTANELSGDASVLLGDGNGGFSPAPGSPFPAGHSPNDIAVGDFNRDGWLDLAFANHETQHLTVLLGDGRGGFAPAPQSPLTVVVKPHPHGIATGAFKDGVNLDLVTDSWAEDRLEVLFGDGKAGFATPGVYVAVGRHPYQRVRVADLNGDGKADIVVTNSTANTVTVILGR